MRTAYLVALMLISVGVALCGGAGYVRHTRAAFEAGSAHATGRVIDIVVTDRTGGERCFAPRVRFDVAGVQHEFVPSVHTCPSDGDYDPPWSEGDEVAVLYDPANPARADLDGFFNRWLLPLVLGVFGVVLLACGAFAVHVGRDPA